MEVSQQFTEYLEHLAQGLGHKDRRAGLRDYCTGLMQTLGKKNAQSMAQRFETADAVARHQALHHFVSRATWSDEEILRRVAQWVVPRIDFDSGGWWTIGYTEYIKYGGHSVGVARQRCVVSGKRENCQVAVNVSLACEHGSLPLAWRLYLPQVWADDETRRMKVGVPAEIQFATKTQIALQQIEGLLSDGRVRYPVLADVGCGMDAAFRQGLSDLGLQYMVGITSDVLVWHSGADESNSVPGKSADHRHLQPQDGVTNRLVSVKAVAKALPGDALQTVRWSEGGGVERIGRFAAVRVRQASGYSCWSRLQAPQWLLLQWPPGEPEPTGYWLSTLPESMQVDQLVAATHYVGRVEKDHQTLKRDFGLDHYEGRGWRGFHHHAVLCIASYGFALAEGFAARRAVLEPVNCMHREPERFQWPIHAERGAHESNTT